MRKNLAFQTQYAGHQTAILWHIFVLMNQMSLYIHLIIIKAIVTMDQQQIYILRKFSYKYPLAGYPNSIVSVKAYDLNTRVTKTMDLPIGETDYVPSIEFGGDGNSQLMVMILNRDQNNLKLYSVNPRFNSFKGNI